MSSNFSISDKIRNLAPSATLAVNQLSNELKSQGIDVVDFSVGEPDVNTAEEIKSAACKAVEDNFSHYTPVTGYLSLRQAICDSINDSHRCFTAKQIICSNGAKQSISNALTVLLNPGDEAIIPAPYWVSYPEMVKLAGGVPVIVKGLGNHFKLLPQQLENVITDKTKVLILNSPCNPSGAVYSVEELRALADVIKQHNIFVISDEVYLDFLYFNKRDDSTLSLPRTNYSISVFVDMIDRVAVVSSVSKNFAMPGYRLGWLAGPQWLVDACAKYQGQTTGGPSSIAQKAAEAAYKNPQLQSRFASICAQRRELVIKLIADIPLLRLEPDSPQGAFYAFANCEQTFGKIFNGHTINNSLDLAMYLLQYAHVACVAGSAFGVEGYMRFSFATSTDNLREGFRRIKEALT